MNLSENTLAQIVTMKPATATVFENHNLDYCCHGKQTLKEACQNDFIKLKIIEHELEEMMAHESGMDPNGFSRMPVEELIDHIINKHHRYVKESSLRILAHLRKATSKHGEKHPELHVIHKLFSGVCDEMAQHMYKEEHILFPRIREIAECANKSALHWMHEHTYLTSPIHVMETDHEKAGEAMHHIRSLTKNYVPPQNSCLTFKITYDELCEFENDLHRHVHLENNILFPKAIELFKKADEISLN